jgi:hypothetical protein
MRRFQKGVVQIAVRDREKVALPGLLYRGLAVHRPLLVGDEKLDGYCVTHIPTGLRIRSFSTQRGARRCVELLYDYFDGWERLKTRADVQRSRDVTAAYRAMLETHEDKVGMW